MKSYQERLHRLQAMMQSNRMSAMVLPPGTSMRYISGFAEPGFERLLALIIPASGPPRFLVPALNAEQARRNPAGFETIHVWEDEAGWKHAFTQIALEMGLTSGAVGLGEETPARFSLPLADLLPQSRLVLAEDLLSPLRRSKDAEEMSLMQQAADATDSLLPAVYAACRVGASENEAAEIIHRQIAQEDHQLSFDPIIAAGKNGASPHHHTGKTQISSGDVIILDLGARVDGYCGDITRTITVGGASEEAKRVYETVYRAYQVGVAAVQPGANGEEVDAAARQVIVDAGYGPFFVHRTGHGIGLDDHEPPFIVSGNKTPLQPGECFSIEPGIYLPGQFGVRLENIITVQEDGTARVLNEEIPRELPIL
jgi:Xaa-Pro dipeptidase